MSGSKLGGWWWKSYLKLANIIEPVSNAVFLHVSIIPSSYLAFCTVASWTVFPILLGKFHSPLPTQFLVLLSGLWQFWQTFAARRLQCRDTPGWSEVGQDSQDPVCQCWQHRVFTVASSSSFIPYTSPSSCVILDGWRGLLMEESRV